MFLTSKQDASYEFITANIVKIHDHDIQRTLSYLLPRYIETEGFIENWVQCAFKDGSLAFFYSLVSKLKPNFNVWIWNIWNTNINKSLIAVEQTQRSVSISSVDCVRFNASCTSEGQWYYPYSIIKLYFFNYFYFGFIKVNEHFNLDHQ